MKAGKKLGRRKAPSLTIDKLHINDHPKYAYSRKKQILLGQYDEIIIVFRGLSSKAFREFTVIYKSLIDGRWRNIRKHCWMEHRPDFHTHIRVKLTGEGGKKYKILVQPNIRGGLKKALLWAEHDMIANWYIYKRHFLKSVKIKIQDYA